MEISSALNHTSGPGSVLDQSPKIRRIMSRMSRRTVYGMISSTEFPAGVAELFAAYSLDAWGIQQVILDASKHGRFGKWRRIAALFALGHIRADRIHELLSTAIYDSDVDVASAAASVLQELGDWRSAEILASALGNSTLPSSRIATNLDQFPMPVHELIRPLLKNVKRETRFWAASLLARYAQIDGIAFEVSALIDDEHAPVRKAVVDTLAESSEDIAVTAARSKLDDPINYVRSTAVRSLGRHGLRTPDVTFRSSIAGWIAPALSDGDWIVRLAAKESLVELGAAAWRVVSEQLESPDEFARNGAAEVLQNLGVIDWTMGVLGSGGNLNPELFDVLARSLREGGQEMVTAAVERSDSEPMSAIDNVLARLKFVGEAAG